MRHKKYKTCFLNLKHFNFKTNIIICSSLKYMIKDFSIAGAYTFHQYKLLITSRPHLSLKSCFDVIILSRFYNVC